MKRKVIKSSIAFVILFLLVLLSISFFFIKNDAPIIHGSIEYGIKYSKKQKLDIYYPTQQVYERSPIVLFIHGGAWIGGRKEAININRINGAINQLRDYGYTIISPEYTLARDGKSPFPECIQDGFKSINWIVKNADSLNLDLNNFGIIGESAGAHISMMNVFANPADFNLHIPKTQLDYLVNIYGPNELWDLYNMKTIDSLEILLNKLSSSLHNCLDLPSTLFGFDPKKDSLKTRKFTNLYSPIYYVQSKETPPTLIIHGTDDHIVPVQQSIKLHAKLDSMNIQNEIHLLKGVEHAFIHASDEQKSDIQNWISSFIIKQYNN